MFVVFQYACRCMKPGARVLYGSTSPWQWAAMIFKDAMSMTNIRVLSIHAKSVFKGLGD